MATLSRVRGDTWSIELALADLTDYETIDFTIKEQTLDTDAQAILQVRKNVTGLDDGLLILNKAEYATPVDGSVTINNVLWGLVTIAVEADVTKQLEPRIFDYDAQAIYDTGAVHTYHDDVFRVTADVTRAT